MPSKLLVKEPPGLLPCGDPLPTLPPSPGGRIKVEERARAGPPSATTVPAVEDGMGAASAGRGLVLRERHKFGAFDLVFS